jgi:hypothetical protein
MSQSSPRNGLHPFLELFEWPAAPATRPVTAPSASPPSLPEMTRVGDESAANYRSLGFGANRLRYGCTGLMAVVDYTPEGAGAETVTAGTTFLFPGSSNPSVPYEGNCPQLNGDDRDPIYRPTPDDVELHEQMCELLGASSDNFIGFSVSYLFAFGYNSSVCNPLWFDGERVLPPVWQDLVRTTVMGFLCPPIQAVAPPAYPLDVEIFYAQNDEIYSGAVRTRKTPSDGSGGSAIPQDLGGQATGGISVVTHTDGTPQIFYSRPDGTAQAQRQLSYAVWLPVDLGGYPDGDIASAVASGDHAMIFYRNRSADLCYRRRLAHSWLPERLITGAEVAGGLCPIRWPADISIPGTIMLVYRNSDGRPAVLNYDTASKTWDGPTVLTGSVSGGISWGIAPAGPRPGDVPVPQIFYCDAEGTPHTQWYASGKWSGDKIVRGHATGNITVVSSAASGTLVMQMFYRGRAGAVISQERDPNVGTWDGEEVISEFSLTDIAAVAPDNDIRNLQIYYRNRDAALVAKVFKDNKWSAEEILGTD